SLQQQIQQTASPQQKAQLKNQLNDVHQEISKRTQNKLQAFAEQSPKIKNPEVTNNLQIRR
ncbi:hypothetical protein KGF66_16255, partial [Lactiplantibacillus pentosus]|nr:hypothetical protein [Lactiplantibacillus pentosus]